MVILLYNIQTLSFVFARCSCVVFGLLLLIVFGFVFCEAGFQYEGPQACSPLNEAVIMVGVSKTHCRAHQRCFFNGVFALLDNSAHAPVDFSLSVYKHFQLICLNLPYAKCRVLFFRCFY